MTTAASAIKSPQEDQRSLATLHNKAPETGILEQPGFLRDYLRIVRRAMREQYLFLLLAELS